MTISQRPQVSCILADLDDTCYENTAMQHHVADNIRRENRQQQQRQPRQPRSALAAGHRVCAATRTSPPTLPGWCATTTAWPLPKCQHDHPASSCPILLPPAGYMAERLEIPADEVAEKCADYYVGVGGVITGLL